MKEPIEISIWRSKDGCINRAATTTIFLDFTANYSDLLNFLNIQAQLNVNGDEFF